MPFKALMLIKGENFNAMANRQFKIKEKKRERVRGAAAEKSVCDMKKKLDVAFSR
mgnify:CR=1 FL=1